MFAMFTTRTVVVSTDSPVNFNLHTAAGAPVDPVMVFCTVTGTAQASSPSTPSFTTGTGWVPGTALFLSNSGTIKGQTGVAGANGTGTNGYWGWGGAGGLGGSGYADDAAAGSSGENGDPGTATPGQQGGAGGIALEALYPLTITNNGTIIGGDGGPGGKGGVGVGGTGGGGGGGGGGGAEYSSSVGNPSYYAGGNGGNGADGYINNNQVGTSTAVSKGGNGGTPQVAGTAGTTPGTYSPGITITAYPGKAGGPAGRAGASVIGATGSSGIRGYAVSGYNQVQFVNAGTITGPTK